MITRHGWGACLALVTLLAGCADRASIDTRFTPPVVASASTTNGATPMFVITPDGGRVLSWVSAEGGGDAGVLQLEVRTPAGETIRSTLRDPLGGIEPHGEAPPVLAAGPDGSVYVLYTVGKDVGARFPASALRFARSSDGGRTWETPSSVNEGDTFGSHNFQALLPGPDGVVYAAWLSSSGGESAVWLRASHDGGRNWDPVTPINQTPTCPCCRTGLALAPDGTLYASWRKIFDGDIRDVVVAASRDGGATWSEPVRPRHDEWNFPGCPHAGPSLKAGTDGVVHIAWWTGKSGEAGVWYARSTDGGQQWSAQPIAIGERSIPSHVQLALGADNAVVVGWDDGHGALPTVMVRSSLDNGVSFEQAVTLSEAGVAATFPVLGIHGDSLSVAWSQVADSTFRAAMAARPDMSDTMARMMLPRVGTQEIIMRSGALLTPDSEP